MADNLEVYETVKRWMTKLEAKSRSLDFDRSSTKRAGLYWLGKYLKFLSTTPERPTNPEALIMERMKQLESTNMLVKRRQEEFFEEFIVQMRRDEYASNSIAVATGLIRSFYKANRAPLVEVTTVRTFKVRQFKIPTVKDLKKMCENADPPLKAWLLCQANSGLANGDLLNLSLSNLSSEYGTIKHQLKKGLKCIHIEIRRQKTGERTDTFFGPNAVEALKEYVTMNESNSRIFKSPSDPKRGMSSRSLEQQVKSLAIKSHVATKEVPVTPYCLRRFFNTYMKLAGINESLVELMMGHSIGKVRGAYLVLGQGQTSQGVASGAGVPISKLAEIYMQAYPSIDINNV